MFLLVSNRFFLQLDIVVEEESCDASGAADCEGDAGDTDLHIRAGDEAVRRGGFGVYVSLGIFSLSSEN
jgi:hypothetical protein